MWSIIAIIFGRCRHFHGQRQPKAKGLVPPNPAPRLLNMGGEEALLSEVTTSISAALSSVNKRPMCDHRILPRRAHKIILADFHRRATVKLALFMSAAPLLASLTAMLPPLALSLPLASTVLLGLHNDCVVSYRSDLVCQTFCVAPSLAQNTRVSVWQRSFSGLLASLIVGRVIGLETRRRAHSAS